ncbi:hypothetical protein HK104_003723 [Borealophlyctis nickersoniae]|nr:hypothetical protein HK104_003723 [Borealophlyctis nickersoniae]
MGSHRKSRRSSSGSSEGSEREEFHGGGYLADVNLKVDGGDNEGACGFLVLCPTVLEVRKQEVLEYFLKINGNYNPPLAEMTYTPSATDCLERPLHVVQRLLREENVKVEQVPAILQTVFAAPEDFSKIPLLNNESHRSLPDRTLVRFRCMVQDNSFEEQLAVARMTVRHKDTNEVSSISTLYMDAAPEDEWDVEDVEENLGPNDVMSKRPFFCVNVPGETSWAQRAWAGKDIEGGDGGAKVAADSKLRVKIPILGDTGAVAAIVKTYEPNGEFRLNETFEIVGVIENRRCDTSSGVSESAAENGADDFGAGGEEQSFFDELPRIHAVFWRNLDCAVPALHNDEEARRQVAGIDISMLRESLLNHMETIFMGDRLAAEYLLLYLLARRQEHSPGAPVGHFPVNFCKIEPNWPTSQHLHEFLTSIVSRCHKLPLTLEKLNTGTWYAPSMERVTADLKGVDIGLWAGELQLANGTKLMIDETTLDAGNLQSQGTLNISHLGELVRTGSLPYIVRYGEMRLPLDVSSLILSQGRSMFQPEIVVPVAPAGDAPLPTPVPASLLDDARLFLAWMRQEEYSLPDDLRTTIANEFAAQRASERASGDSIVTTPAGLSRQLEVAKLVAKSFGLRALDAECWERAKELERKRMARVHQLPKNAGAAEVDATGR